MNKLNVSLSPHVHSGNSTQKCMLQVIIALCPALLWSFYQFGLGAIIVTLTSVCACVLFEFLIQKFVLKVTPSICDLSAVLTGLLLAFNVPSNLPIWIIIIGALVAIGIGKMSFGGLGQNIFNPALVGRVFLLVAYPVQMTTWPVEAGYFDVATGATPLALITQMVNGVPGVSLESLGEAFLGTTAGSMGEDSALLKHSSEPLLVRWVRTLLFSFSLAAATCFTRRPSLGKFQSLRLLRHSSSLACSTALRISQVSAIGASSCSSSSVAVCSSVQSLWQLTT